MRTNYKQRKSIRIKNFNYSNGSYFVTFCTQHRKCLFGNIDNGELLLNDAGLMVHNEIATLEKRYIDIYADNFIVMPNHVHAIIVINNNIKSLPDVVRGIKTFTTRKYIDAVNNKIVPSFDRRLWQRGYYESVIRDKNSLNRIRKYITLNPMNWNNDRLYLRNP